MKKPHKKKQSPPRQTPPISPDALLHPWLLPYAEKLRKGKAVGFDEKFAVPCTWDTHDGILEWLKHGRVERLAALLKDDPFRMVHPVIQSQIRQLVKLSRGLEETDPFPDSYGGPLRPEGTRHAACTDLLKIFQGMWSAFLPNTSLNVKSRKDRGHPPDWQKWEREMFLEEYKDLKEEVEKLDSATDEAEYPLRRGRKESESAYVKRIIKVVEHLHSLSRYGLKSVKQRNGPYKGDYVFVKNLLPFEAAKLIVQQAIRKRSVQKHVLLTGLFAHNFSNDHSK